MEARARYYAGRRAIDFRTGAVFGPHGQDLIVANAPGERYDDALSRSLTADTVTANLAVRELGFKPYILSLIHIYHRRLQLFHGLQLHPDPAPAHPHARPGGALRGGPARKPG